VYLKTIEQKQGLSSDQLDDILRTHLLEPRHLRQDDFQSFFGARIGALASLVATAMNKPVVEEKGSNEREVEIDPEGELDEDAISDAA
jgi:hypothetical protein